VAATLAELRIELAPAAEALGRVGRRLVEALRSAPDPGVPVPGLEWTLGELTAHLAARTAAFVGYLGGAVEPESDLEDQAALNQRQIEEARGVPFETNVELVSASVAAFVETTKGRLGTDRYPWLSNEDIDVATGTGLALAELLVHGHDVGRALRRPWPIGAEDARTALKASLVLAPRYLDREAVRGRRVTVRLAVRGLDPVRLRIEDQRLTILPPGPEAEATIRSRPAPFLLTSFGRISSWRAAATLKVVATGRRPWAAITFTRAFRSP
jgi:hypothetical protein